MSLYKDANLQVVVDDAVLYEGDSYFLDLSDVEPGSRLSIIKDARIEKFGKVVASNPVFPFAINGFVGTLSIAGKDFDLRSKKLNLEENGPDQFTSLLKDIDRVLRGLTFRYNSPTTRAVSSDHRFIPTDEERLHFFRKLISKEAGFDSLTILLELIVRRPHQKFVDEFVTRVAGTSAKLDLKQFVRKIHSFELAQVPSAAKRPATLKIEGNSFLPRTIPVRKRTVSYDTPENRLVLFILRDMEGVCLRMLNSASDELVRNDARMVLDFARRHITNKLFKGVGPLTGIPSHSTVLSKSYAYARLYELFLISKTGITHLLQDLQRQSRNAPLKDIATLYELWVFLQIVDVSTISRDVEISGAGRNRDLFTRSVCWNVDGLQVFYNYQHRSNQGSYSLAMRPDVMIEVLHAEKKMRWHFDAKYKLSMLADTDEAAEPIAADVHKMHTYVDSIESTLASLVIYPGTVENLYPRNRAVTNVERSLLCTGGVGALPLAPGRGQDRLRGFISIIREQLEEGGREALR